MTSQKPLRDRLVDERQLDEALVAHRRLALVVGNGAARTVGLLIWTVLAVAVAWPVQREPALVGWAAVSVAHLVLMGAWGRSYRRCADTAADPARWERSWAVICVAQSTWAGLWWVLFAPYGEVDRTVLVVILFVVILMGAAASSASTTSFVAFAGPSSVLLVTSLLLTGGPWFLMGVLGVPLGVGVLLFHLQVGHRMVGRIRDRLRLQLLADRQDLIFETVAEPLVITVDGVIEDGNQHFADLLRDTWDALRGRTLLELVDVTRSEAVSPDGNVVPFTDGTASYVVLDRADGTSVTVEVWGGTLAGHPGHQVWSCRDVTARLADERALRRLADHDHLTGVLNRRALSSRLDDLGSEAEGTTGILIIDLDGFKAVNDQHGHLVGDRVLEVVADRIGQVVRGRALVGRLGGDEFMVLAHGLRHRTDLERVATRICDACRAPVQVGTLQLSVSASVGLSTFGALRGPDEAIAEADEHMYAAKRSGGDRWVGVPPGS